MRARGQPQPPVVEPLMGGRAPFFAALVFLSAAARAEVGVEKGRDGWAFLIDGRPFLVKGVGCNTASGPNGEDYLAMAKDMGANAVRTWGITPRSYFDRAHELGLRVSAGVWYNAIREGNGESYEDPKRRKELMEQTLAHVREMKDHPALLTWNLGNEVFAFTEFEEEKVAFGKFLEDVIRAVKKEDPNHPVVYASAGRRDLPYLKKHVPSLDIVGVNTYAGVNYILRWMDDNGYDKPVVLTEFGPYGAWDRPKDINGLAFEPEDYAKASSYAERWQDVLNNRRQVHGGYAFVLGDSRNQDSYTWWNVNTGGLKRQSFWRLFQLYTGAAPANACPRIRLFKADPVKDVAPGEPIDTETRVSDPDGDRLSVTYYYTDIASDPLIVQPARFYPAVVIKSGDGTATVRAPNEPGTYRLYVSIEDGKGNVGIANRSVTVKGR